MNNMIKTFIITIITFAVITPVVAKKTNYIYRKRANWVKLVQLSNKQLAGHQLNHPYTNITSEQMTGMLMSLKLNKAQLFKKGYKTTEIFNVIEARKYAPLLVKAFMEAGPNQVINMSVVHKRPYFILRNDHISIINMFVTDRGLHLNFTKLYAKLTGDYKQASRLDESIRKAKSIRVSLQPGPGQSLVSEHNEIILDPYYDFANNVVIPQPVVDSAKSDKDKDSGSSPAQNNMHQSNLALSPGGQTTPPQQDIKTRLQTLEDLRKSKLISEAEYKQKRNKILQEL